ncbi:DUF4262 domain-containing protein [Gulosibacter faecalis]|uniref:DUF4262 domain-containing protein n=1 Tax=Gulosibacter faecalis TaxID=272240 RepID=A0ABW5UU89_9MICO|nr:DUF4262 domain-containing protein [Gulosibacter faecalis]
MSNDISDAQLEAWLDQEARRIAETIRTHRWAVEYIMGERETPPFAYTVGLFGLGHPELIVFGLDHSSSGQLLNSFGERILEGGDLLPGEVITPEGADTQVRVEVFPDPGAALYGANDFYHRPREYSVPAL